MDELKRTIKHNGRIRKEMYKDRDIVRSAKTPPPVKNCLTCGKEFQHNNSFCSAGCCKLYKEKG